MEAALGHQGQQAQGFQADRLTAGVGAGNDQGVKPPAQLHVDGHSPAAVQQRVAGPAQIYAPVPADLGAAGIHAVAELAPGKNQVQPH